MQMDLVDCETHHWWFGYAHYAADLAKHPMIGKLGPNALDLSLEEFRALLQGRRGAINTFLLDQDRIAGIGNVYVQTPLWRAKIHPLRPIPTLTDDGIVVDLDGSPMAGATVRWRATDHATTTAPNGQFNLGGLPGGQEIEIAAWADGYRSGCMSNRKVCDAEAFQPLAQGVR